MTTGSKVDDLLDDYNRWKDAADIVKERIDTTSVGSFERLYYIRKHRDLLEQEIKALSSLMRLPCTQKLSS